MPARWVAVLIAFGVGWTGAHWWYVGRRDRARRYLWMLPVMPISALLAWRDAVLWLLDDRRAFDRQATAG